MKVVHIISGLQCGGAEMMLLKVLRALPGGTAEVISLTPREPGSIGDEIEALGIPVRYVDSRGLKDLPVVISRLANLLRSTRPKVVQTWLYHADLLGGLAARALGIPVIWGIRHSDYPKSEFSWITRASVWTCARLSRTVPVRITVNSEAARRIHEHLGYSASKMIVVPNGFELERFQPDPRCASELRAELSIPDDAPIVGLVARYHPQKDHRTFFLAAEHLARTMPDVWFVLCGSGVSVDNPEIADWAAAAGVASRCRLLGQRKDVARILAGSTLATLTSCSGESFPNVIGEAMACGTCCVATDVGDTRDIIGDTGTVVPPRSPEELSQAWEQLLRLPTEQRKALGEAARRRVQERYSIAATAATFRRIQREAASGPNHAQRLEEH